MKIRTQTRMRRVLAAAAVTAVTAAAAPWLAAAPTLAIAQDFPTHRVTAIVPYPPGGVTDIMTRILAEDLQKRWNQPVVVDNKPGVGASVGALAIMKAPPDGHTFMLAVDINASYPVFTKDTSYDFERDLAPVTASFYAPYVMVVSPQLPVRTLPEFIAYARANPGKVNWASHNNSSQLLDVLSLLRKLDIKVTLVPYKGGPEGMRAVMTDEAQAYFGTTLDIDQLTKSGRVKALAVTTAKPFPPLPGLPTIKSETGIDFDSRTVYGYVTTVGTPPATVDKLYKAIADVVMNSELNGKLKSQGYQPTATPPAEWGEMMRAEGRRAREMAQSLGIKPQ